MSAFRVRGAVMLLVAALAASGCEDLTGLIVLVGLSPLWVPLCIGMRKDRLAFEKDLSAAEFSLYRQSAEDRLMAVRRLAPWEGERGWRALPWLLAALARETDPDVAREMMRLVDRTVVAQGDWRYPRAAQAPPPLIVATVRAAAGEGGPRELFILEDGEAEEHADVASFAAAIMSRIARGTEAMICLRLDGVEASDTRAQAILSACGGLVADVEEVSAPVVRRGAADGVPLLVAALDDGYVAIRRSAAYALGAIGPEAREAVPALQRAARDAAYTVREAAEGALRRIQGRR